MIRLRNNLQQMHRRRNDNMILIQTTVIGLRRDGITALGSDGQVTLGNTIVKATAVKIRKLYDNRVLAGFAGSAADGLTLFDKFEQHLKSSEGQLIKAAVDLATEWRQDKILRRLEAFLIVMDKSNGLIISGNGDVIEPDDGILSIGSGSPYALAAARAMLLHSNLPAQDIVREALQIASDICIYTNSRITIYTLEG